MSKIIHSLIASFFVLLFSFIIVAQENEKLAPPIVSGGVLNAKATQLVQPIYPPAAKAVKASGQVNVQVTIDENGDVISASAVSGHPLLRAAAVEAARQSKFSRTKISGQPIKVKGVIVYNFNGSVIDWGQIGFALGEAEAEILETDELKTAADSLAAEFVAESRQIKDIIAKFEADEESYDKQSSAFIMVINSLQAKLAENFAEQWQFEFGLTKGRLWSSCNPALNPQNSLFKFRQLAETAPEDIGANTLTTIRKLGEFANKTTLTRRDWKKIDDLLDEL